MGRQCSMWLSNQKAASGTSAERACIAAADAAAPSRRVPAAECASWMSRYERPALRLDGRLNVTSVPTLT